MTCTHSSFLKKIRFRMRTMKTMKRKPTTAPNPTTALDTKPFPWALLLVLRPPAWVHIHEKKLYRDLSSDWSKLFIFTPSFLHVIVSNPSMMDALRLRCILMYNVRSFPFSYQCLPDKLGTPAGSKRGRFWGTTWWLCALYWPSSLKSKVQL